MRALPPLRPRADAPRDAVAHGAGKITLLKGELRLQSFSGARHDSGAVIATARASHGTCSRQNDSGAVSHPSISDARRGRF